MLHDGRVILKRGEEGGNRRSVFDMREGAGSKPTNLRVLIFESVY